MTRINVTISGCFNSLRIFYYHHHLVQYSVGLRPVWF